MINHLCNTPCGPVQGTPARAPGVTAYKGIRYATAGRWQYPAPVTRWEGTYDATRFGPCAIQENAFRPEGQSERSPFYYHEFREGLAYTYDEDCLFLNIWAPDGVRNAPVIVYIHGGAFLSGSGWDKVFDEPAWPRQGAVAVTLNYRLGVLGYACLPELAAEAGHTGNYGLYDQLCALQWVHDNIAAFGGDPGNVTLMGQSAGARSVQMLCSTAATRGLIHRAVMSSGGGDPSVLFQGSHRMADKYDFWTRWRQAAGAADLAALRALPAKTLLDALDQCVGREGFGAVMDALGPVRDNALFPEGGPTLAIPYMAGGNSEDMRPELAADALAWCRKQPVPGYAWYFCRQLPGDGKGAWHSADLWYWFGALDRCWRPFTEEDRRLSARMVHYLVNFARTGDPNSPGLPAWEPAGTAGRVLRLDTPAPAMGKLPDPGAPGVFGW